MMAGRFKLDLNAHNVASCRASEEQKTAHIMTCFSRFLLAPASEQKTARIITCFSRFLLAPGFSRRVGEFTLSFSSPLQRGFSKKASAMHSVAFRFSQESVQYCDHAKAYREAALKRATRKMKCISSRRLKPGARRNLLKQVCRVAFGRIPHNLLKWICSSLPDGFPPNLLKWICCSTRVSCIDCG